MADADKAGPGMPGALEDRHYLTLEEGVKGTDNCPRCGRTMARRDNVTVLTCEGHGHSNMLLIEPVAEPKAE